MDLITGGQDTVALADLNDDGPPDIVTNSGVSTYVGDGALRSPPAQSNSQFNTLWKFLDDSDSVIHRNVECITANRDFPRIADHAR